MAAERQVNILIDHRRHTESTRLLDFAAGVREQLMRYPRFQVLDDEPQYRIRRYGPDEKRRQNALRDTDVFAALCMERCTVLGARIWEALRLEKRVLLLLPRSLENNMYSHELVELIGMSPTRKDQYASVVYYFDRSDDNGMLHASQVIAELAQSFQRTPATNRWQPQKGAANAA